MVACSGLAGDAVLVGASAAALQAGALIARELAHGTDFSLARVRQQWPSYAPWDAPSRKLYATRRLTRLLDVGLSFQVLRAAFRSDEEGLSVASYPTFSLFGLLALELLDSIQNDLPYGRCAKCRRWFHRQQGRSQKQAFSRAVEDLHPEDGPRKKGVLYCTNTCARAKAQAAYYQRKKSEGKAK